MGDLAKARREYERWGNIALEPDPPEVTAYIVALEETLAAMLAALKSAREDILSLKNFRCSEAEGSDEDWVRDIDAAIAKAEAES